MVLAKKYTKPKVDWDGNGNGNGKDKAMAMIQSMKKNEWWHWNAFCTSHFIIDFFEIVSLRVYSFLKHHYHCL